MKTGMSLRLPATALLAALATIASARTLSNPQYWRKPHGRLGALHDGELQHQWRTLAFELSCKTSGDEGGTSTELDCDVEGVGAPTKSVDFGVVAALGVDIMASPGRSHCVLYSFGTTDIDDFPTIRTRSRNRTIQKAARYGFRFRS